MISSAALIEELHTLGRVDVPQASLKRVWLRVLSECTTEHPADSVRPHSVSPAGITGHASPSPLPSPLPGDGWGRLGGVR